MELMFTTKAINYFGVLLFGVWTLFSCSEERDSIDKNQSVQSVSTEAEVPTMASIQFLRNQTLVVPDAIRIEITGLTQSEISLIEHGEITKYQLMMKDSTLEFLPFHQSKNGKNSIMLIFSTIEFVRRERDGTSINKLLKNMTKSKLTMFSSSQDSIVVTSGASGIVPVNYQLITFEDTIHKSY